MRKNDVDFKPFESFLWRKKEQHTHTNTQTKTKHLAHQAVILNCTQHMYSIQYRTYKQNTFAWCCCFLSRNWEMKELMFTVFVKQNVWSIEKEQFLNFFFVFAKKKNIDCFCSHWAFFLPKMKPSEIDNLLTQDIQFPRIFSREIKKHTQYTVRKRKQKNKYLIEMR